MKYKTNQHLYQEPNDFTKKSPREVLQYALGGMLYMPATKIIDEKLQQGKFQSICLDLEDSVGDDTINQATNQLIKTLKIVQDLNLEDKPLIFIRPRNPNHAKDIYNVLMEHHLIDQITGFNFPKFERSNAVDYKNFILEINTNTETPIYFNPILESPSIMDVTNRTKELKFLNNILGQVSEYILNIRVGATDFCNIFGIRRSMTQSIYDSRVIADCLSDIVNVFGKNYVVSGPVWEYFNTAKANQGLKNELTLDKINGFFGKTAIHPEQLQIINDSNSVSYENYQDALSILGMNQNILGVQSGHGNNKMNETKTHINWAKKIVGIADIYGVLKA